MYPAEVLRNIKYKDGGKTKECDLLPIREVELKTIMEQVAGRKENVERIILYDGHIDFLMKDGTVKSHIRKYSGDGFNKTPFSRKIFCGYCEFDAGIWSSLVQEVVVKAKDDIRFIFKNGFEVRV